MAYFECVIGGGGTSLTIQITTTSAVLYGQTITISKGGSTVGTTAFDNTGNAEYTVRETGTYTVSVTYSGTTFSNTVEVTDTFDTEIYATPDGSTVTPVNDIQIWLHCGNVWDKNYTALSEVLADTTTLLALINSNNAVDYMVRSHDWCDDVCADATAMTYIGANNYAADTLLADSNEGLVPVMTSDTTPSGECIGDSYLSGDNYYEAFNGDTATRGWWSNSNSGSGNSWIGYEFPTPKTVCKATLYEDVDHGNRIGKYKYQYHDGNDWEDLSSEITHTRTGSPETVTFKNNVSVTRFRLLVTSAGDTNSNTGIKELQFYSKDGSWLESICNSTYFESVLNVKVPTMTSNTTPSGEAFASQYTYSETPGWKAFNGQNPSDQSTNCWGTTQGHVAGEFVGYEFTSPVVVRKAVITNRMYSPVYGIKNFKIQASSDGSTYADIATGMVQSASAGYAQSCIFPNSTARRYCRVYVVDQYSGTNGILRVGQVQFYGRAAS